jgi:hypothetical protein
MGLVIPPKPPAIRIPPNRNLDFRDDEGRLCSSLASKDKVISVAGMLPTIGDRNTIFSIDMKVRSGQERVATRFTHLLGTSLTGPYFFKASAMLNDASKVNGTDPNIPPNNNCDAALPLIGATKSTSLRITRRQMARKGIDMEVTHSGTISTTHEETTVDKRTKKRPAQVSQYTASMGKKTERTVSQETSCEYGL